MEKATHFIEYWAGKERTLNNHEDCDCNDYPFHISELNTTLLITNSTKSKTVAVLFIRQATTPLADRLAARGLTI